VRWPTSSEHEYEYEAKALSHDLHESLRAFALHPEKTRLIRFGRYATKPRVSLRNRETRRVMIANRTHEMRPSGSASSIDWCVQQETDLPGQTSGAP
jgi:hypothetical protein